MAVDTFVRAFGDRMERPKPFPLPKKGGTWPPIPDETYWFRSAEHHVGVEIAHASDGSPIVVGITVRRTAPLEPRPPEPSGSPGEPEYDAASVRLLDYIMRSNKAPDGLLFVEDPRPLSSRDVRRMALDRYVRAALDIAAGDHSPEHLVEQLRRVRLPRGRPERDVFFYRDLLTAHRELGKRPEEVRSVAAEIARRKSEELGEDIDVNTVYQWVHRARELEKLGRLGPPKGKRT